MNDESKGQPVMFESGRIMKWMAAAAMATLAVGVTIAVAPTGYATSDDSEPQPRDVEDEEGWLNYVDYYVAEGDEIDEIRNRLIREINDAEKRIDAAISKLDDPEIEQALLDAASDDDRDVKVRIVADEMYEDGQGFDALVDHSDISVQFGDGELAYLPEPTVSPLTQHCRDADSHPDEYGHDDYQECTQADGNDPRLQENNTRGVVRPAHYNIMSHTFFLIDDTYVWNITAPLTDEQPVWLAFRAMSEEMANSFGREFRQMHGGVFSTTLSIYNGPLKSVTHQHALRLTNRGALRVRFNPQERLVKNVVDEVYRARSSVYVMTENLTNRDLIAALHYKKQNGFDVRLLLGQGQAQADYYQEAIAELDPVVAPEQMGRLPTMVVIDSELDRNDRRHPRLVQILSHELWAAQPYEIMTNDDDANLLGGSDWVRFYPSDTFADGVLWEVEESGLNGDNMYNPEIDPFVDKWEEMWEAAN